MEWERAKTYLLLFFVLLNLTLGGLLLYERRRYTVTPEREQAIITIMNRNNIEMDTRFMRRFPPMRGMYVAGFYYDEYQLIDIFFDGAEDVQHVNTLRERIFSYGPAELRIAHGFVSYVNPDGHGGPEGWLSELNHTEAQRLTDAFVQANWRDFRLDDVFVGPDMLRLSYRQVYRGHLIHTNFIEFIVTHNGIVQIEMQFARVQEWADEARPIVAPDIALLTFVRRVQAHALAQYNPIVIDHMDLVYFQMEGSPNPYASYQIVPFYRIFIDGEGLDPFLINAFTNEIIN